MPFSSTLSRWVCDHPDCASSDAGVKGYGRAPSLSRHRATRHGMRREKRDPAATEDGGSSKIRLAPSSEDGPPVPDWSSMARVTETIEEKKKDGPTKEQLEQARATAASARAGLEAWLTGAPQSASGLKTVLNLWESTTVELCIKYDMILSPEVRWVVLSAILVAPKGLSWAKKKGWWKKNGAVFECPHCHEQHAQDVYEKHWIDRHPAEYAEQVRLANAQAGGAA